MTVKRRGKRYKGAFLLHFTRVEWNGQAMARKRWRTSMPPMVWGWGGLAFTVVSWRKAVYSRESQVPNNRNNNRKVL